MARRINKLHEIEWNDFTTDPSDPHRFICLDPEFKTRYALHSVNGSWVGTIEAMLVRDPKTEQIEPFLKAVNSYRSKRRVANGRE